MSTVATFIEEILGRVEEEQWSRLYPALNRAIRIIAKRLFVVGSDLVIGKMSIPGFAEQTYTAATIAFVDNGDGVADTITDSASQFVIETFAASMPITTSHTVNAGPFKIYSVAAGIITVQTTDVLTTQTAGASYTITSDDSFAYLPSDFWGLVNKPYISGLTYELEPLPGQATDLVYPGPGNPVYFRVIGDRLYLTPATSSNITVLGDYWKRPVALTKGSDVMPYYELFDDVLAEYVVKIMSGGIVQPTAEATAVLNDMVASMCESVEIRRTIQAPKRQPQGFNWSGADENSGGGWF